MKEHDMPKAVFVTSIVLLVFATMMRVALMTALTFKMTAQNTVCLLVCMYIGAIYGGSRSAIHLNIPGTLAFFTPLIGSFARRLRSFEFFRFSIVGVMPRYRYMHSAIRFLRLPLPHAAGATPAVVAILIAFTVLVAGCGKGRGGEAAADTLRLAREPVTLSYWGTDWIAEGTGRQSDPAVPRPLYRRLEELTGVRIAFLHPQSRRTLRSELAALVASGDLPDIIECNPFTDLPGGPVAAAGTVFRPLAGPLLRMSQNLLQILMRDEELLRTVTGPDGVLYGFPSLKRSGAVRTSSVPLIRKAWLAELGMEVPRTVEDWEAYLRALLETRPEDLRKNGGAPFSIVVERQILSDTFTMNAFFGSNFVVGAFGTSFGFHERGDRILYGPAQPEYLEALRLLRSWFHAGLINNNLSNTMLPRGTSYLLHSGSWTGTAWGAVRLMTLGLIAAPAPALAAGRPPSFGVYLSPATDGAGTALISTANRYPQETVRFLDFAYGAEGKALYNYGTPEVTSRVDRDRVRFLDSYLEGFMEAVRLNRSDRIGEFLGHSRLLAGGPFEVDEGAYGELIERILPGSRSAMEELGRTGSRDPFSFYLLHHPETMRRLKPLYDRLNEARTVTFLDFLTGRRDLEEFPRYLVELDRLGLRELVSELESARRGFLEKRLGGL